MDERGAVRAGVGAQQASAVTEITLLSSDACHLCHDARLAIEEIGEMFPIRIREIDMATPEGRLILERFRPPMPPAVLIDGELFSFGRLSRKKLVRYLERAA